MMKKFSTRSLFLMIAGLFMMVTATAQFPTIYASKASGTWQTLTTWETFTGNALNTPGTLGSGTPAASVPSGTHLIYIRAGHAVALGGSNRSCFGMVVEPTGKLWANEAAARRLQLVNGGTGFLYPQTGSITNNGEMGGVGDGLFFETGTNCQNVTITGTGSTIVQRLRMPGAIGIVNVTIDKNITFTQAANYAMAAAYNPVTATDNYTITINAGKVVTISDVAGYFNSNANTATGGTYTYNINGTLNLSASTQTAANLTAMSPAGGTMVLNINGSLITGAAFNASPTAPGIALINVANGVTVDATLATVMSFAGSTFILSGTGGLKRTVPNDGTVVTFPISTSANSFTGVNMSNLVGTSDVYTATVKNTFTNPAPVNSLLKEWNITEGTAGGNENTIGLSWLATDEAGSTGFDHALPLALARWDGSAWVYTPAVLTGAGTVASPYVATAPGFSAHGFFAVANSGAVLPVQIVNLQASKKAGGIQVNFGNATELNVASYVIEKSTNGSTFTTVTTLLPKTNNGLLNNYSHLDADAVTGTVFYRIRATEVNGNSKYSSIVIINSSKVGSGVNVYPNPLTSQTFALQLENLDKAVYSISLFNAMGQKVFSKQIKHEGNTATFIAELPASVKPGVYSLEVWSNLSRTVKTVVVQ